MSRLFALLGPLTPVLIMILVLLTPEARALNSNDNAALKYWRAFSLISEEQRRALGTAYSEAFHELEFPDDAITIDADALLDQLDLALNMLIDASRLPDCDFAHDWHLGIEAVHTEIGWMFVGTRLLLLSAAHEMKNDNHDAAARRVAAAIRMSRHLAQNPVVVHAMVADRMFRISSDMAMEIQNAGAWTDDGRALIAEALSRFPADDLFGHIRAIHAEERLVGDWMEARLDNEWKTPESFAQDAREVFGLIIKDDRVRMIGLDEDDQHADAIRDLLQGDDFRTAMQEQIGMYRKLMRMVAKVWDEPDAEEHFERFLDNVENGGFGVLTAFVLPTFTRAHRLDMEARNRLAELRLAFRAE